MFCGLGNTVFRIPRLALCIVTKFAISIGVRLLKFLFPFFFSLKVNFNLLLLTTEFDDRDRLSQKKEKRSTLSLQVATDEASYSHPRFPRSLLGTPSTMTLTTKKKKMKKKNGLHFMTRVFLLKPE